ncbi:uncharacterized protein BP5553_10328 [Venustampulla echinocandica]|uniref:SprT-like domain-containing protein n=1 Tax=Venustampulla echinocandica TaxID=2656787 RepID=A0A370T9W1_9HELO|nr:uncharacterized protein BP5553_10328 [Venustampulla echinocandica]RDL30450.1 hypothetical protein BP5553_10328 [Venustampulla echinocandica]
MARIAVIEDSDDEFPEIAELLKAPKIARGAATTSTSSRPREEQRAKERSASRDEEVRKGGLNQREGFQTGRMEEDENSGSGKLKMPSARLRGSQTAMSTSRPREKKRPKESGVTAPGEEICGFMAQEERAIEARKAKPKKRVLKQKTENPLLRPIAGTSAASSSFLPREKKERINPTEARGVAVRSKRAVSRPLPKFEEDERDTDGESDGISDFIVSDNSSLGEEEEEESIVEKVAPRSTRKLVRGRRPPTDAAPVDELNLHMVKLTVQDLPVQLAEPAVETIMGEFDDTEERQKVRSGRGRIKEISDDVHKKATKPAKEIAKPRRKPKVQSSDTEDPFTRHFSPPQDKPRKISNEARTRFTTPPSSPEIKPKGLVSPSKKPPRIPRTPHRPSMDTFWSQDVVNDWNDEYSPRKEAKTRLKSQPGEDEDTSGGTLLFSPAKKSPVKQTKTARDAKKAFSEKKNAIAHSFLAELDEKITDNKIAGFCASTGGVKIAWSKKLLSTAGRANWKRETIKSSGLGPDGKPAPPTYRHHATIELAEKVIDDEDRLLNVVAHEFCHLANYMVSNMKTNPHGKEFKAWASKCSHVFGNRGIRVTTKHSYAIDYKYVWECENCGLEFKRHSRSIDPKRHQCGVCKSKLVQTQPVPKNGGKVSEYQVYVKENMARIKEENPGSPQKEIMGLVGKGYGEFKALKLGGVKGEGVGVGGEGGSREVSVEDDRGGVGVVAKKLDFLDLKSL